MLLSRAGVPVTVLERQPHVGGRTSTFHGGGYTFDLGATFFLYPRVLEEVFAACGYSLRREVPMTRLDPQYHLVFGAGGDLRCTADVPRMEREVSRLSPEDAQQFRRFLDDNRVKLERFRPALERPFLSPFGILSWDMLKLLPTLRPWLSLDGELSRYFRDPRVRLAFSFQSKYLGMSPFRCPSLFSILSFLEYEHGVWHPMGGCGAVSRAMARLAERMGAEVRTGEDVEEVLFDGRRAVGVRTSQGQYPCDALVINADFARAMKRLVPSRLRRRWSEEKIAGKRFSCSTFMLYLGVEGLDEHVAHHTVYMSRDYEKNLDEIENRHVLSDDPSFYVQNAAVTDPSLAPPGHGALYVLAPVSHMHPNIDWAKEAPGFRARVLRQLERVGLRDVEKRIRWERMVTPADWDAGQQIHLGATFNLSHDLGQMLHLRPRNRFEELEGVYLTGGGTHPGSGLPVIYESARISSRLLLQDWGMDWSHCTPPASRSTGAALALDPASLGRQPPEEVISHSG
jgi:phytoene desaturase